jgi:tRNA nucleotidyltransferase/poly(A) polymerase/murein DD-endopeptidase MepM/ murein hydrolase activator NlpD
MKNFNKNAGQLDQQIDSLFNQLTGSSLSDSGIEEENISNRQETDPAETSSSYDEKYQLPVRVGRNNEPVSETNKPWVVGTFIPGKYVNETHKTGHNGVDLKAPKGTPIYPIASGTVIEQKVYPKSGNSCKVAHEGGAVTSFYAHMDTVSVSVGTKVTQRTVLGTVGSTGNAINRGSHCHFETKVDGSLVDPFSIVGKTVGSLSKNKKSAAIEDKIFATLNKYAKNITRNDLTIRLNHMKKIAAELDTQFILSDKEQQIFDLLKNVIKDKAPGTTLRAAGGWVRDKLLGKDSHDIDIAVDNMSGAAFANIALEWMKENKVSGSKNVTKVEANPEANKNLETAILPILGISIDFVQLRKDTYDEDSRNPSIETGVSAEEDAKRRDLTINSIFYNINDGKIEDYVGGIEDLKNSIARTPIAPLKTYLEDPLRILRAVRFAAKYNLKLDPDLIKAARDPKVQEAFRNKITKERIWTELVGQQEKEGWKRGLMIGPNFHKAAELLEVLGLRDLLLTPTQDQMDRAKAKQPEYNDPTKSPKDKKWEKGFTTWDLNQNNPHHNLDVWKHTLAALKYLHDIRESKLSEGIKLKETDEIVRNLAMLFHDIGKCDICSRQEDPKGHSTYHEHELSSAGIAEEILTDIKAPTDIKNRIVSLVKNHMRLHTLPEGATGVGLRRIVRDIGAEDWPNLVDMSKSDSMGKEKAELSSKYDTFAKVIDQFLARTGGKSETPMPINGKDIMQALGLTPGAKVGQIVKALKEKLIEEPDLSKEDALSFIKTVELA